MQKQKAKAMDEILQNEQPDSVSEKTPAEAKKSKRTERKRARYTSYLLATVAIVVALVVGLNVAVGLLSNRYHLVLDFTGNSLFTISEESTEFVKTVDLPVTVYLLNSQAKWESTTTTAQIVNMVRSYAALNPNIKLQFLDLDQNPTFKNQYASLELTAFDVLFVSEYRYYRVSQSKLSSYLNYQSYYTNGTATYSSDAENLLTGALVNVCSKTQPVAYFLTGNGQSESDNQSLNDLLSMNSYAVETVNLVTAEIPTTNKDNQPVDFLIIANPTTDFTAAQLQKIDAFLRNNGEYGKNLLYFGSYTAPNLPNLYAYLAEWGIGIGDGLVMETNTSYVDTSSGIGLMKYNTEDETAASFAGDLNSKSKFVGGWPSQNFSVLFEQKEFITTHTLLSLNAGKLYYLDAQGNDQEAEDQPASFPVAILSERVFTDSAGYEKPASNVVAFGSNIQNSNLLSSSTLANEEYLINTVNTLIHKEETVHVSTKIVASSELSLPGASMTVIIVLFVGVLPAVMLAAGLIIWLRRRKL